MISDYLYWHAVNKARQGNFSDAKVIFALVYEEFKVADAGVGLAYCCARLSQWDQLQEVLGQLHTKTLDERSLKILGRLGKRMEAEKNA